MGTTTVTLASNLPQSNCIDIARSSSGVSSANLDASAGDLLYIPFAVDGVTAAMRPDGRHHRGQQHPPGRLLDCRWCDHPVCGHARRRT